MKIYLNLGVVRFLAACFLGSFLAGMLLVFSVLTFNSILSIESTNIFQNTNIRKEVGEEKYVDRSAIFRYEIEADYSSAPNSKGENDMASLVEHSNAKGHSQTRRILYYSAIYSAFNAIVLTIIIFFRIRKIFFEPVEVISSKLDNYYPESTDFICEGQQVSPLKNLSRSIESMVERIESDRAKLKEAYLSLEKSKEDLERSQGKLIAAEKFAASGRLAAGVAHEIGNPLSIVEGYLGLLSDVSLTHEERLEYLRRCQQETARIDRLIHSMISLDSRDIETGEQADVNHILDNIVELYQPVAVRNGVKLILKSESGEMIAKISEEGLLQILSNLLANAFDAIKENDELQGEVGIVAVAADAFEDDTGKKWARVDVSDNGIGMSDKVINNIFDPFFTTKEPGKGTGLGLSIVSKMVKRCGGSIDVESVPGTGSVFRITLPVDETLSES